MIPTYPEFSELDIAMRRKLHPLFQNLGEGMSEFTFAGIYLFREAHRYRISDLTGDSFVISGEDLHGRFFMLPFRIPDDDVLSALFQKFDCLKNASETQAGLLEKMGYRAIEDRDNFDYLYLRADLANLSGRKFHKKKNLVNAFLGSYSYEGRPLLDEYKGDALEVLETWRREHEGPGDYEAAVEALSKAGELQLCGGIYYVEGHPAAYTLGEEVALGRSFVTHFEKGISKYRGIYQFVNQCFASILPDKYLYINREQDLGDEGLRQAKLSYRPAGFVRKYRVIRSEE